MNNGTQVKGYQAMVVKGIWEIMPKAAKKAPEKKAAKKPAAAKKAPAKKASAKKTTKKK